MIEFIIPLNLPVRAVMATATIDRPPARIAEEIVRWSARHRGSLPIAEDLPMAPVIAPPATTAAVQQESQQLQVERAALVQATEQLRQATKDLQRQTDSLLHEFQQASVELAHAIASKLVFDDVEQDRFPIASLVHEVISRLNTKTETVVRMHPADLALIEQMPTIGDSENEPAVRFVADSNLQRGDCRAKSGEISVIYELRRQIDEIRQQLLSTVNGHVET